MPRNSRTQGSGARSQGPGATSQSRDLATNIRVVLGTLLALNLIAFGLVLFPPGGSADDLERELTTLQTQVAQKQALLPGLALGDTVATLAFTEPDGQWDPAGIETGLGSAEFPVQHLVHVRGTGCALREQRGDRDELEREPDHLLPARTVVDIQ